jgi:hypothetical protein
MNPTTRRARRRLQALALSLIALVLVWTTSCARHYTPPRHPAKHRERRTARAPGCRSCGISGSATWPSRSLPFAPRSRGYPETSGRRHRHQRRLQHLWPKIAPAPSLFAGQRLTPSCPGWSSCSRRRKSFLASSTTCHCFRRRSGVVSSPTNRLCRRSRGRYCTESYQEPQGRVAPRRRHGILDR